MNSCNLMSAEDHEGMIINLEKYQVEPGIKFFVKINALNPLLKM